MKTESTTYKTSDLPLAAYLSMSGLSLLRATKGDDGRFEFQLDDPEDLADILAVQYLNSECSKFDYHVRRIKKLLYSK